MEIEKIINAIRASRIRITDHADEEAQNDDLENNQWAVLITVYRPDPNRWLNWKQRITI